MEGNSSFVDDERLARNDAKKRISRINRFLVLMPIPNTCDISTFVDDDTINTMKMYYGIKREWELTIVAREFKCYDTIIENYIVLEAFNYLICRGNENYIMCQMWAPEKLVGEKWEPNPNYQVTDDIDCISIQNLVCQYDTGKWMICSPDDTDRYFPKITHCLEVLNHWFISPQSY